MKSKLKLIIAMLIFGTIGIFVKNIPLSSIEIAFSRALLASLFLLISGAISGARHRRKSPFSGAWHQRKEKESSNFKSRIILLISGVFVGFNWVLLFEAYKYTTVGKATLAYYFAPVFILILSPFVLKERLNKKKLLCILGALIGLFFIVDIGGSSAGALGDNVKGILLGVAAALLYASFVLMNKFVKGISDRETTLIQLSTAALVLFLFMIYSISTNGGEITGGFLSMTSLQWVLLLMVGIVHTGVAYEMYFSALKGLKAQSAAILSYIDPISAVFFAAIFLNERMTFLQLLGGGLILLCTYLSEGGK